MCRLFLDLTFIKKWKFYTQKLKIFLEKFWWFGKKQYLCTRFREKISAERKKKEFFERFT